MTPIDDMPHGPGIGPASPRDRAVAEAADAHRLVLWLQEALAEAVKRHAAAEAVVRALGDTDATT